jgi:hypothetical protein
MKKEIMAITKGAKCFMKSFLCKKKGILFKGKPEIVNGVK